MTALALIVVALMWLIGCGSARPTVRSQHLEAHRSNAHTHVASSPTPAQRDARQFRYIAIGPVIGPPDGIRTNGLTSDDFAFDVFTHYFPLWFQHGRQPESTSLSVPSQSGTPLAVRCSVAQDRIQHADHVRCVVADGSVTTFNQNTLLAFETENAANAANTP
jgi:hypothetical protein